MRAILQELIYDSLPEGAVWPFERRYIRPPHFHGQLECLVIQRGRATMHLGTRAETVRAGHLVWVLPGIPHVMDGFSTDFDMWVIELDAALVGACWRALGGSGAPAPDDGLFEAWPLALGERLAGRAAVDVGLREAARIGELARLVWRAPAPAAARIALRALGELALRATWPSVDARPPASAAELASCLLLASPTLDRPAVARELGVSEGFVSRSFQRELGVTFVEHRARTRVAHFLALVQRGRSNLLGAALDAGFGSYSQFHRVFSRAAGSRPRDYLDGGRHRLQLFVAGDGGHPDADRMKAMPDQQRHRAPMDA